MLEPFLHTVGLACGSSNNDALQAQKLTNMSVIRRTKCRHEYSQRAYGPPRNACTLLGVVPEVGATQVISLESGTREHVNAMPLRRRVLGRLVLSKPPSL